MTPAQAYAQLNQLLWVNRLPKAKIMFAANGLNPRCQGFTLDDTLLGAPVIFLNGRYRRWGKTLVHEMLHIAEPRMPHGKIFDALVNFYWRIARKQIEGLDSV